MWGIGRQIRESEFFIRWLLNAAFDTFILLFIVLVIVFAQASARMVYSLHRSDLSIVRRIRLIPLLLVMKPADAFASYGCRLKDGTYLCSYHKLKRLRHVSRTTLAGIVVLATLLLTLIVISALLIGTN